RNMDKDANANLLTMVILVILNAPRLVEQTIPFVVLFGTMGALFVLNKRSEMIVMRASGVSAWRFLKPAVFVTASLGIIWSVAFNPLAAKSGQKYENVMAATSKGAGDIAHEDKDIWLREGTETTQVVIHARSVDLPRHTLKDAVFYYFDLGDDRRPIFSARYDAKTAELKPGFWVLSDVIINENGEAPVMQDTLSKSTQISLETLRNRSQAKNTPPFWQIRKEIRAAKKAGFDPTPLILHFHKLLALPITLIAMTIIAACASLNMTREGGTLKLLIIGGALGFGGYFADSIVSAFGETQTLPPVLAAWAVPIFVLLLGLAFLSKIEDG
ncbi:MAG TPA: LptF/LptG family permease, partial [Hellea balneolensis]|nr:LptF/LptG family permease [Hellea balneolensis]